MKNRWNRFFWTEIGRMVIDHCESPLEIPVGLPGQLTDVLKHFQVPESHRKSISLMGDPLDTRMAKHIYDHTWNILRENRFSRPLRLEPWPGVHLLIPFAREPLSVLPQSFSRRIPVRERSLSIAGRCFAASMEGYRVITVLAMWNDEVLSILKNGGVDYCSLDRIEDMLCRFS